MVLALSRQRHHSIFPKFSQLVHPPNHCTADLSTSNSDKKKTDRVYLVQGTTFREVGLCISLSYLPELQLIDCQARKISERVTKQLPRLAKEKKAVMLTLSHEEETTSGPDLETKTKQDARGLQKSPALQWRTELQSCCLPPNLPDQSVMQLHFNKREVCKGHFQTPRMLYVKESNTALRGLCLVLPSPGWVSELPDRKHIWFLKLDVWWRDRLLWFEFTSM